MQSPHVKPFTIHSSPQLAAASKLISKMQFVAPAHALPDAAPRPGSKQAPQLAMMKASKGATLGRLVEAIG